MKKHPAFRVSRIFRLCAIPLLLLLLVSPTVSVLSAATAPTAFLQAETVINARSTDKDVSFTVASSALRREILNIRCTRCFLTAMPSSMMRRPS